MFECIMYFCRIYRKKSLEESGLLIKGVSEAIENKAKEQKRRISSYGIRYIRC